LEFSVKEGDREICNEDIPPYLYTNIDRTCHIIGRFRDVIHANLLSSIEPFSFMPALETYAWSNISGEAVPLGHLRVVLFGRGDPKTDVLHEARWGVFNESDDSCKIFEIHKIEGAIRECLLNVLLHRLNIASYAGRLRVEATLDSDNKVESLALLILNRVSFFDKNISLNEERWAMTLISAQPGSESDINIKNLLSFNWRMGHAMIACEGVKDGCQFFKCLHLTKNKADQCLAGAPGQARIKIKKEFVTNTLNGPTWIRPKTVVESILHTVQEADKHSVTVPFAMGRKIPELAAPFGVQGCVAASITAIYFSYKALSYLLHPMCPSMPISFYFHGALFDKSLRLPLATLATTGIGTLALKRVAKRYDCLQWALEQLQEAGIKFKLPWNIITPNAAVQYLNEHPEVVTLEGTDSALRNPEG
ncbi:MAG TPA: hypothetical protein VHA52_08725, partial [Candidatus Babeliaceae bacterium]|nr:hypothetical protein [Candidatus Babeliaceae bacterium]